MGGGGGGLAINAGGPAVATSAGNYLADQYFSGGLTYQTSAAIAGTTDDVLYQTERFGNFSYAVPVANGAYSVTLQFAEIFFNAAGQRVFDVTAEGALVLDNLDIWSAAGGQYVAKDFVIPVSVTDGVLNLQFTPSVDNAKISAIRVDPAPTDTVAVTQSGGSTAVTEGGATDTLSLALASQPTANVTVTVGGNADVTAAPNTLTFTAANWNVAQTVTVSAVNDTLAEGPETASVTFATSSSDARYNNLSIAPVPVSVTDNDQPAGPTFTQSSLAGLSPGSYTSLQFGSDQRLYVAAVEGTILALTVQKMNGDYLVTATETINAVRNITNFNDDGSLAASSVQNLRQVTGILVTSTPASPVTIYVSSSDPRIGAGPTDGDVNLDTNSGVISRLTQKAGGGWDRLDLVRGLPRSEENHSVNGLQLSADGQTLFVSVGGNTNHGAPSNNFAYTAEYAYSAAIVSIDLTAINAMATKTDSFGNLYKYNLPTLPPGSSDPIQNDPFGGRDGLSQAVIVNGGPVQVYSPGYRNAYDLVLTQAGKLYTVDNGGNSGWGGLPIGEGTANVTNQPNEGGTDVADHLHLVTQGFYAGHPNPIRANPNGAGWYLDGSTTPVANLPSGWPPVPTANPVEGDFRAPGQDGALYSGWNASTNGLTEYTASTFDSAMKGNLLVVSWDDQLYRVVLSADGASVISVTKLTGSSTVLGEGLPLDVTTQGDGAAFAGDIFVANYGGGITVFSPNGGSPPPPNNDTDGDGLLNNVDRFAEDPANGKGTDLAAGQTLTWSFSQNIDPPGPNGLFNMGFTGLMSNNTASYLSLYDPANIKPGGAAAGFQIEQVPEGDALAQNSQQNGFQFGVDVQTGVTRFVVETKIDNPFGGSPSTAPVNSKSQGFFIGTGDQDNYLKVVAAANGGAGGIQVAGENAGASFGNMYAAAITGSGIQSLDTITLRLTVDVATGVATPDWTYTVGGSAFNGAGSPVQLSGATLTALQGGYSVGGQPSALAVGIISTSLGSGQPFTAFWQSIEIRAEAAQPSAGVSVTQTGGSTAVTEGGATDTVSVALASQPTSTVMVTVSGNADVTPSPTTLTFTAANWNIAQTVTVAAVDDSLVEGSETANITFASSSSDARYNGLVIPPVPVGVTDNDQVQQPPAPTGLDLAAVDDTGLSSSDNITLKASGLTISGSGQNGATVTLYDDANNNAGQDPGETTLATATVSGGAFSADIALASGTHPVRAFQTAGSGVGSASSSSLTIVVDTTAPAPVIASETMLANGRLRLTGLSEAGSVVSVFDGATKLGEATTASNGSWTFTTSSRPADTLHQYSTTAVDVAGNTAAGANVAFLGSSGKDTISGGAGNDIIFAGAGADRMTGAAGDDIFVYSQVTDSRPGAGNFDTVTDFVHGDDVFDFAAINGLTRLVLHTQTPATIAARTIDVVTTGSDTIIYANASNATQSLGSVDMEILVLGVTNLTSSDFLI